MPGRLILAGAIFTALLGGASAASAQASDSCDPISQLKKSLVRGNPHPRVILAFDHQRRSWAGFRWDGRQLTPLRADVDIQVPFTNKPRLFLTPAEIDGLQVFVINTDPLIYSTKAADKTVANLEDLAALQKFAGLLGGAFSSLVASAGPLHQLPEIPSLSLMASMEAESKNMELARKSLSESARRQQPPIPSSDLLKLAVDASQLSNELQEPGRKLDDALKVIKGPSDALSADLQALGEAVSEIKGYLQLVENGASYELEPRKFGSLPDFPARFDQSFKDLAMARTALEKVSPDCVKPLISLRDAINLYRIPLPTARGDQRIVQDRYQDDLGMLAVPKGCSSALAPSVSSVAAYFSRRAPTAGGSSLDEDSVLRPLLATLDTYLGAVDLRDKVTKTATDLLAQSGNAVKNAAAVQDFRDRRQKHLIDRDPCSLEAGVIPVDRLGASQLRWFEVGTEGFQVNATSAFKEALLLQHADASGTYEIQRASHWDFDVDVATYYTDLSDPKFSAVKKPDAGTDDKPVIAISDETNRAGELAMFLGLQWRSRQPFRSRFSVGPQIGVGLNTDHAAVFTGLGFGLGPYVKLGVGWTWQQVKALRRGQLLGDEVANTDSIKVRNVYDNNYYISLSITLDNLPFFKAP